MGAFVTGHAEKTEIPNAFFVSVFNAQTSLPDPGGKRVWVEEDFPLVKEDLGREHLGKNQYAQTHGP